MYGKVAISPSVGPSGEKLQVGGGGNDANFFATKEEEGRLLKGQKKNSHPFGEVTGQAEYGKRQSSQ